MTLIAILLAMATERYWHPLSSYRLFSPLVSWRDVLASRCGQRGWFDGAVGVLLTVAPAVLIIALLQYGLAAADGVLMWLLKLGFSLLILVACVGDQRFGGHMRHYLKAVAEGDTAAASLYLSRISSRSFSADNLRQLNRDFLGLLLIRLNERVLALLFWFVVLGPLGAVLYRSVAQLYDTTGSGLERSPEDKGFADAGFHGDGYRDAAQRLKGIMNWLPARLTALCYAMIGSFTDAMQLWRDDPQRPDDDWVMANDRLLLDVGIGALQLQSDYVDGPDDLDPALACEHVLVVRSLSRRTLLAWVTILALMTLVGWLG